MTLTVLHIIGLCIWCGFSSRLLFWLLFSLRFSLFFNPPSLFARRLFSLSFLLPQSVSVFSLTTISRVLCICLRTVSQSPDCSRRLSAFPLFRQVSQLWLAPSPPASLYEMCFHLCYQWFDMMRYAVSKIGFLPLVEIHFSRQLSIVLRQFWRRRDEIRWDSFWQHWNPWDDEASWVFRPGMSQTHRLELDPTDSRETHCFKSNQSQSINQNGIE
jgi:hypothetical protein